MPAHISQMFLAGEQELLLVDWQSVDRQVSHRRRSRVQPEVLQEADVPSAEPYHDETGDAVLLAARIQLLEWHDLHESESNLEMADLEAAEEETAPDPTRIREALGPQAADVDLTTSELLPSEVVACHIVIKRLSDDVQLQQAMQIGLELRVAECLAEIHRLSENAQSQRAAHAAETQCLRATLANAQQLLERLDKALSRAAANPAAAQSQNLPVSLETAHASEQLEVDVQEHSQPATHWFLATIITITDNAVYICYSNVHGLTQHEWVSLSSHRLRPAHTKTG
jgi:hypothetical protein